MERELELALLHGVLGRTAAFLSYLCLSASPLARKHSLQSFQRNCGDCVPGRRQSLDRGPSPFCPCLAEPWQLWGPRSQRDPCETKRSGWTGGTLPPSAFYRSSSWASLLVRANELGPGQTGVKTEERGVSQEQRPLERMAVSRVAALGRERMFLLETLPAPERNFKKEIRGGGVGCGGIGRGHKTEKESHSSSWPSLLSRMSRSEPGLGSGPASTTAGCDLGVPHHL